MKKTTLMLALTGALGMTSAAHATLVTRPGGMVYDTVLNITWLQNANVNGLMNWNNAVTWADNLVYGGYSDWRLPSALNQDGSGPCGGGNCNNSEMGYLYYVDGITPTSMGPFINVQNAAYWSGTELSPGDPNA